MPLVGTLARGQFRLRKVDRSLKVWDLTFPNRIGLAAGFDKDGQYLDVMPILGFGFIELGTVTPRPQSGNPRPRLFRLPTDGALLNRMGFNNQGVDELASRLERFKRPPGLILGGNIGKNRDTPNDKAVEDYLTCFERLYPLVDYFVVNVSSPNTPGLRELQEKEPLRNLLSALMAANREKPKLRPILLKIAPDLTETLLDNLLEVVSMTQIHGLVVANTTAGREGLRTNVAKLASYGSGGISGKPVKDIATAMIATIYQKTEGTLPIIGVVGIFTKADAQEKLEAGATLLQVYTGLIYEGPTVVRQLLN